MKAMRVKNGLKFLVIIMFTFMFGCKQNNYKESISTENVELSEDYAVVEDKEMVSKFTSDNTNVPLNLKIIKTASSRYKVKNIEKATREIKAIAQKHGAYISDLRFQNDLYKKENRFTIKVPQMYFDTVMDSVNTVVDFVEYENITTKDVTEEYIDVETRLKTKLEVKARYEAILRKNAKTVEDILLTEDKLRIIQEEIESAQGRLKYLTSKVAFSTIQIDLYESVEYKVEPETYTKTFWDETKQGFANGWWYIESFVIVLINLWPLLIIAFVILFFVKKRLKK